MMNFPLIITRIEKHTSANILRELESFFSFQLIFLSIKINQLKIKKELSDQMKEKLYYYVHYVVHRRCNTWIWLDSRKQQVKGIKPAFSVTYNDKTFLVIRAVPKRAVF